MGTLALRVAGARKTSHRGHTEAVVFHAVDLAVETGEICEHKRGRSRFSRRVKYPEPWGPLWGKLFIPSPSGRGLGRGKDSAIA